jgi:hypothetical protein
VAVASAATITRNAETKSYALTLVVGPVEKMYTTAQVKAMHPETGEVMVGDSMGGAMSMGNGTRHVEVHIQSRASGKVMTNVTPTMMIRDKTAMAGMNMGVKVPVMAMQGIGQGVSDLHYGNNVPLKAGHTYVITVTVKKEPATFTIRA